MCFILQFKPSITVKRHIIKKNCNFFSTGGRGPAVDPECDLKDVSVYCGVGTNGSLLEYSVVLGRVDIEHNRNSYCRMQVLRSYSSESK